VSFTLKTRYILYSNSNLTINDHSDLTLAKVRLL